jgi:hypothetical protein
MRRSPDNEIPVEPVEAVERIEQQSDEDRITDAQLAADPGQELLNSDQELLKLQKAFRDVDGILIAPEQHDRISEATEAPRPTDSPTETPDAPRRAEAINASEVPNSSFNPELAADSELEGAYTAVSEAIELLKDQQRRWTVEHGESPSDSGIAEQLEVARTLLPQAECLRDGIQYLRSVGPGQASAGTGALILALSQAVAREAKRQRRRHRSTGVWDKLATSITRHAPWLVPAIVTKTKIKEWTLAGAVGVPGVAQVNGSITFE